MKEALGILRQETSILDGKDIQKILHARKPTLLDVTREGVRDYLNDDLKKLTLLDNSIANRDIALKILCDAHGPNAGLHYYGLLNARMVKSKPILSHELQMHPRSLERRLQKIVDPGIALTLTDREEPLPPLHVRL
jgi:hypothetical protein